ncbi:hypothetical protein F443_08714 [Phytophthora nicotianae P1569]|uniref:Uncharacterized protein n=1 Tax=Phytophthora nicotianae P1569 TaxID=1317065 RepID=V9F645_PHYNI|nr:hypothetical protein F443_08714 [Phytophthora nicotianae P1569]
METVGAVDFWLEAIVDLEEDVPLNFSSVENEEEEWYVYDADMESFSVADRSQKLPGINVPSFPRETCQSGIRAQNQLWERYFPVTWSFPLQQRHNETTRADKYRLESPPPDRNESPQSPPRHHANYGQQARPVATNETTVSKNTNTTSTTRHPSAPPAPTPPEHHARPSTLPARPTTQPLSSPERYARHGRQRRRPVGATGRSRSIIKAHTLHSIEAFAQMRLNSSWITSLRISSNSSFERK